MKRFLFCILALWPSWAWGDSWGYSTIGGFTRTFGTTDSTIVARYATSTTLRFQATLGDVFDSAMIYAARGGGADDSVGVVLYASGGANVDEAVWQDTIVVGAAGWYSTGLASVPFYGIPHGIYLYVGVYYINDNGTTFYYDVGGSGDEAVDTTARAPETFTQKLSTNKLSFRGFYHNNGITYDWGGPKYQEHADSMYATYGRSSGELGGQDSINFGAFGSLSTKATVTSGEGAVPTRAWLMQIKNDPRTGGYTQDSIRLYFAMTTQQSGDDTVGINIYALNKAWGEGTKNAATAAADEMCWQYAKLGTTAWTGTDSGGCNSSDHTPTDSIMRWTVGAGASFNAFYLDGAYFGYVTIPAPPANAFTYGMIFQAEQNHNTTYGTVTISSDDYTLTANKQRPFFIGWETAPAAASLSIGGGTVIGGNTVIGGK